MLRRGGGQDYGALEASGKGQESLSDWESWVVAFGTCDVLGGGGRQVADVMQGPPGLSPQPALSLLWSAQPPTGRVTPGPVPGTWGALRGRLVDLIEPHTPQVLTRAPSLPTQALEKELGWRLVTGWPQRFHTVPCTWEAVTAGHPG